MRIAIVTSYGYWGAINPDTLFDPALPEQQIGGGETAMLQIAVHLAKLGHEVTVFYDTHEIGRFQGVDFMPSADYVMMVCHREWDVIVSWDAPWAFRFADRGKVHVMAHQLNAVEIGIYDWTIDLYMHPSVWHAQYQRELFPYITKSKQISRITNGIDFTRYQRTAPNYNTNRVIYSSSPDRGLHHLLRIWPRIVEAKPLAELHVFYDAQRWLQSDLQARQAGLTTVTSERAEELRRYFMTPPKNVLFRGAVGQWQLAREQLQAHVLAYPCDPVRPTEGFSMTILEGITAGLEVITTNADALPELWSTAPGVEILPLPINDDEWIEAILKALDRPLIAPRYNPRYAWATLAKAWEKELQICLLQKRKQLLHS